MGWLIALGIVFLLAILPLGVSARYDSGGPLVRVILGPIRLTLFPQPKKQKKKEKKAQPESDSTPAAPPVQSEPQLESGNPPPPPETGKKEKSGQQGGSLLDFIPLVQLVFRFLGDFRRKLRLDVLECRLIMAGGDPANLAIQYGRAWAAVGNLMPQLDRLFVIKNRKIEVECDFTASETLVNARLDLTITLGRLLSLVVVYGFRALKEYLNIRKKRKGGAAV